MSASLTEFQKEVYDFIKERGEVLTSNIPARMNGAIPSLKNKGVIEVFKKRTCRWASRKRKFVRIRGSENGSWEEHGLTHENTTGKRRSRLRIIADILKHAQSPVKQTHIMYECNLSFSQLKRYLKFLKIRALIRRKLDTGSIIYQTTNDGQEFLRRYSSIARLLRSPELKRSWRRS